MNWVGPVEWTELGILLAGFALYFTLKRNRETNDSMYEYPVENELRHDPNAPYVQPRIYFLENRNVTNRSGGKKSRTKRKKIKK